MPRWMPVLVLGVVLTGCATEQETETTPMDKPMPERIADSDRTPATVTGEVPAGLLSAIKADLAAREAADTGELKVLRAQAVVWRDGSLGCPQPGQMYTQALVNGYWVVLGLRGRKYDYRAGSSTRFLLCERGGQPPLGGDPRI